VVRVAYSGRIMGMTHAQCYQALPAWRSADRSPFRGVARSVRENFLLCHVFVVRGYAPPIGN